MDLSRLSEKQKRLKVWQSLLLEPSLASQVKSELSRYLDEYSGILLHFWESGSLDAAQLERIHSIERELQDLDEFSRMRA